jgi:hypothetical protein
MIIIFGKSIKKGIEWYIHFIHKSIIWLGKNLPNLVVLHLSQISILQGFTLVKFYFSYFWISWKGVRLGKWNFQGWVNRLKDALGRYFEVPTSTPSPSRGSWPLMTFKNMCVIKVKPCKIDLLLKWSTTKLFSASQFCSIPTYKVLKTCKYIS